MPDSCARPAHPASCHRVTVFHDGECPLCRIEIRTMSRLDKTNQIDFVDITKDPETLREAGINFEQAMNRFHVRDDSLVMQTGVRGFLCVWSQLPYLKRAVPLISGIPGLIPVLEALYRVFAKYRPVLTGRQQAITGKVNNDRDTP